MSESTTTHHYARDGAIGGAVLGNEQGQGHTLKDGVLGTAAGAEFAHHESKHHHQQDPHPVTQLETTSTTTPTGQIIEPIGGFAPPNPSGSHFVTQPGLRASALPLKEGGIGDGEVRVAGGLGSDAFHVAHDQGGSVQGHSTSGNNSQIPAGTFTFDEQTSGVGVGQNQDQNQRSYVRVGATRI